MWGKRLAAMLGTLALGACAFSPPAPPKWSPYLPARAENFHSAVRMLLSYDSDNDGTVTRRELEAGLRQYFWQADTNRDGRLDPDEVAAANQRRIRQDQSAAIPLIDWNHDGYVDFNEFAAGIRSIFDQLDADGDGQVTPAEFRRGAMLGL
jgi:Ca2+-binding EF-hand superfamily protein